MYTLQLVVHQERVSTTRHATAPFVPRKSDKVRIGEHVLQVIDVVIEYDEDTIITVYLEKA